MRHLRLFLLFALGAQTLQAQQPPDSSRIVPPLTATPIYKDPELAAVLAFVVPGGGQLYTGRFYKGVTLLVGGGAGAYMAATACRDKPRDACQSNQNAWLGLALGSWFFGLFSAHVDAQAYNQRVNADVRAGRYGWR